MWLPGYQGDLTGAVQGIESRAGANGLRTGRALLLPSPVLNVMRFME